MNALQYHLAKHGLENVPFGGKQVVIVNTAAFCKEFFFFFFFIIGGGGGGWGKGELVFEHAITQIFQWMKLTGLCANPNTKTYLFTHLEI